MNRSNAGRRAGRRRSAKLPASNASGNTMPGTDSLQRVQPLDSVPGPAGPPRTAADVATVQTSATLPWLGGDFLDYAVDAAQRSVLFLDALRERANNMLDREAAGMPPLLHFDWEVVSDARRFERPVNYALLRITGCPHHLEQFVQPDARPVIVIDPRAGHGPGIGGFKRDSEIGVAMRLGHPVYFVSFFPDPCDGQTLGDVLLALERFVAEVTRRHPGAPPVLYGNCQAGWAVALLCAKCSSRVRGPAVLNGSPLSYWVSQSDAGSSRALGFLLGGSWMAHLLADIGHGRFDGAWLALNFEAMNPRHAVWDRLATLFTAPDVEGERFIEFERWWSSFYSFSREEICAIVENLFIGNQLESGELRIDQHCAVDLRLVRNPLVVFASGGDSITPPCQALNWIRELYADTSALKAAGQRIVYLIHPSVGHLGLFVSASVALREHRAVLDHIDEIEALTPGLYEMVLRSGEGDHTPAVSFEPRPVEELPFEYDSQPFESAARASTTMALAYDSLLAPWIRLWATPWNATLARWFHPMRFCRWALSERINPWMSFIPPAADSARKYRHWSDNNNPLLAAERAMQTQTAAGIDLLARQTGTWNEAAFGLAYGNSQPRPQTRRRIAALAECSEDCACPPESCECCPTDGPAARAPSKITNS